jgi:hypothetical protein
MLNANDIFYIIKTRHNNRLYCFEGFVLLNFEQSTD